MAVWITRLRGIWLFYRGVAPVLLVISAALLLVMQLPVMMQVPGLHEAGGTGVSPGLLLAKLLSGLAVWYLFNEMQPQRYWFYYYLSNFLPTKFVAKHRISSNQQITHARYCAQRISR